jgi:hypothetical protein
MCSSNLPGMQTWEVHDPPPSRPIAAPLERCAEFLDVDLATIGQAAAHVQPYGRVRGGYLARRRVRATDT